MVKRRPGICVGVKPESRFLSRKMRSRKEYAMGAVSSVLEKKVLQQPQAMGNGEGANTTLHGDLAKRWI